MRHIRSLALAGSVLVLGACADDSRNPTQLAEQAQPAAPAPLFRVAGEDGALPGQYIVVLNEGAKARGVAAVAGVDPDHVYEHALQGFAARLNEGQLNALRRNPNVAFVEEDREYTVSATQTNATWGLDRIDQTALPLNGSYVYNRTGANVFAYVIDTGIRTSHGQFGTRARNVYDAFGGNGQDCNGHGTHVAGTVGGSTHGVAKGVQLRGLRVLDCNGSGSTSGIIAAIDWLRANHTKPAVANLSLGGGFSSAMNTAVNNLWNAGVFVAVAAGNENQNACNVSPASAANVYTVASSTSGDAKSNFSNWGSCVNIYAPGSSITSAWHTSNTATNTISGTSMASPHVAGVAALIFETNRTASPGAVANWLTSNATTNRISGNPTGTPNRLLFKSTW
jgi:subtilisin family serine protease